MNFARVVSAVFAQLSTVFLLGVATASPVFAHGEDRRVAFEFESQTRVQAGVVIAEFQLVDTQENKVLSPTDLNVTHEKNLHLLAYDPSLQQFQHLHPEFDGKLWKVEMNFSVNGNYFVWAQGELNVDGEEFSALSRMEVLGGAQALPAPALTDVRSGSVDGSIATLSGVQLRAGKMAMLTLKFSRADGSVAEVTPYLGAFAHVISTPEDGDSLIHVHPMNGPSPDEGMLHATFPSPGAYRVWVQFIDAGVLRTVPLSVEVTK